LTQPTAALRQRHSLHDTMNTPRSVLTDVSLDVNLANAVLDTHSKPPLLQRSRSDLLSGLSMLSAASLNSSFTEAELAAHYERFKAYDLQDQGFISTDNLKAILTALDIPNVTDEQCRNMIEEVAILSGHENDGSLSFRDYIRCMEYEAKREAVNASIDAIVERRRSRADTPALLPAKPNAAANEATAAEASEPAEPAPALAATPEQGEEAEPQAEEAEPQAEADEEAEAEQRRLRRSSLHVLDMITRGRIARFEQVIMQTEKVNKVSDAAARRQARFAAKLAKFEAPLQAEPAVQQESLYKKSVKDKLSAFESANRSAASQTEFRKTWKKVGASNWQQRTQILGDPPPKRSIHDLP